MFTTEHAAHTAHHVTTIRRAELARLVAMASEPHESALILIGEAGSGKSTLLDGLHREDLVVHRARISAGETDLPYSGLSAIAAAFDDPAVANMSASLLARAGSAPAPATAAAAFLTLLRASGRGPSVLVVDDADLMDAESRAVLSMLAGRLGGTGLRLIASMSSDRHADLLGAIPRMHLTSLDADEALRVAGELTGHRADAAVCNMVVAAAHGNARALAEITARLSEEQLVRTAPIELPFRLTPVGVEPNEPALIARLSCAHLHSEQAIDGIDPDLLEHLLSDGRAVREHGYVRLSDPVLRARVYWSLPLDRRRALHASAEESERLLDSPLAAWHASQRDPYQVHADQLIAAATGFAQGHTWQAVELAERALAHSRLTADLALPLLELARAFLLFGEPAYAERYARWARRAASGHETLAEISLVRVLSHFAATRGLSAEDRDYAMLAAPGNEDAGHLIQLAGVHTERWEAEHARDLLARAAAVPGAQSARTTSLHELLGIQLAGLAGDHEPAAALVARIGGRQRPGAATSTELLILGRTLMFLDRNHDARHALHAVLSAEPAPPPLLEEHARTSLTELEIRAGRHLEAAALIERSGHLRGRTDHPVGQLLLAWRRLALGDVDIDIAETQRQFAFEDPALAARLAVYQGQAALAEGRYDEAVALLRTAAVAGTAFENPTLLRYDVDLIEAYELTGRHEEAMEQARDFARRSERYRTPWTRQARARVEALLAGGEASVAAFDRALKLAVPPDLMFERARTFLSCADRLSGLGHTAEAAEQRRSARAVFTQLGAVQWIRRTDQPRPTATRQAHPLLSTLSSDELRVVDLVRQGLRNKEIAATLFVSLRTVEVRLTRIYQRVGVGSRAQLMSALAEVEPALLPRSG